MAMLLSFVKSSNQSLGRELSRNQGQFSAIKIQWQTLLQASDYPLQLYKLAL